MLWNTGELPFVSNVCKQVLTELCLLIFTTLLSQGLINCICFFFYLYLMCPDLFPRYTKPFLHAPIWWFLNVGRLECSMIFLIKTCWNTVEGCLKYFLVSSGNTCCDVSWHWIFSFLLPCYSGNLCWVPPAYWSVYSRAFIMHYLCISLLSVVRSCFGSNFECSISLAF